MLVIDCTFEVNEQEPSHWSALIPSGIWVVPSGNVSLPKLILNTWLRKPSSTAPLVGSGFPKKTS
jgi:hypothetical protein